MSNDDVIPYHRPLIGEAEKREVIEVLESGWLTTGPRCARFEEAMCAYLGRKAAVSVVSGTAALHLALLEAGVGPGDGVVVPTHTFAASAEAVLYTGATPILAEVAEHTLNLDLDKLEQLLDDPASHPLAARGQSLPRIRLLMPVHYAGLMVDMPAIAELAKAHGQTVIEDAAHTMPARRPDGRGGQVGIGELSRHACLSFYPTKPITTGEGGMIVTDDPEAAERMKTFRMHGLSKGAWNRFSKDGRWHNEVVEVGYKYNLTDIAAAIGIHQLARADELWAERKQMAANYLELLQDCPHLHLPNGPGAQDAMGGPQVLAGHSWHLYFIRLAPTAPLDREAFLQAMREAGVVCAVHWMPLHLHSLYYRFGYRPGDFPVSEAMYRGLVSLPFYPGLRPDEQQRVADTIRKILS